MPSVLGWDIGGVNTKTALVIDGTLHHVRTTPFELQRAPGSLVALLRETATALTPDPKAVHAVTMTAELSQMFRTKRDGVRYVIDAVETAFPGATIQVYATDGSFHAPHEALNQPLLVAAANWMATATIVAQHHPDALLVDVGSTTTDLIPIVAGHVRAIGRTDTARLASAELVYSGAVRTPVEAIVRDVPVPDGRAGVSAEGFALIGDVHVWLGDLAEGDYEAATPDGRPTAREFAGERLARVVCADREMLDETAITTLAASVARAQIEQTAEAIRVIRERHPMLATAVVTGLGAFIGERAARSAGLDVVALSARLGADGARSAPATAVALLLEQQLAHRASRGDGGDVGAVLQGRPHAEHGDRQPPDRASRGGGPEGPPLHNVDPVGAGLQPRPRAKHGEHITVVKLGGSLLADPDQWRAAVDAIAATARSQPGPAKAGHYAARRCDRIVVVPGGGPFADAVRDADAHLGLGNDTAHWMAIAAMDQHAAAIANARPGFARVVDRAGITAAHDRGEVAVLAPLHWLRADDPLPHSWDVTSDSIAAWFARVLKAERLVVLKTAGASGPDLVDPYFSSVLPPDLEWTVCDAWHLAARLSDREPSRR